VSASTETETAAMSTRNSTKSQRARRERRRVKEGFMELSFSLKQEKTDSSLLPKSGITRVMSVLERRS